MKKPPAWSRDQIWKHESWLRRSLDSERFNSIVYFEEAVLAESATLQAKGYYVFVITTTHLYLFPSLQSTTLTSLNSFPLLSLHSVLHLNDAAMFFSDNALVAQATQHIRCHVTDQVASPVAILDFYSFYEDSSLYFHLQQSWQHAQMRVALPVFYPPDATSAAASNSSVQPLPRTKLSKLSKLAIQALFMHQEAMLYATVREDEQGDADVAAAAVAAATAALLSPPNALSATPSPDLPLPPLSNRLPPAASARASAKKSQAARKKALENEYWDVRARTRIIEEMSMCASAASDSGSREYKSLAFESHSLLPFLLGQLQALGRLRAYFLGADPEQVWSYVCANNEVLLEDEVDRLHLLVATWTFLSRLLAGSECVASRVRLLAFSSTSTERELREVMDALFLLGGINVYGQKEGDAGTHAMSPLPVKPGSSAAAGNTTPDPAARRSHATLLALPTRFLELLDAHVASLGARTRFVDEADEHAKSCFLYDRRVGRTWREAVLGLSQMSIVKEASATSGAAKAKLLASAQALHPDDVARIAKTSSDERAALALAQAAKRGAPRKAHPSEREKLLDHPPLLSAEVASESVLALNSAAESSGLDALRALVPEAEVALMELLFHFQQLLEFALETSVPRMSFNLESMFRHLLDVGAEADFKQVQLPVFARGLVHLTSIRGEDDKRDETVGYYTFVYASVLHKFMLRSAELQSILMQQQFRDLLSVDHQGSAVAAAQAGGGPRSARHAAGAGASSGQSMVLLSDIKASVIPTLGKGQHFYQRTKPLLESMYKLLSDR